MQQSHIKSEIRNWTRLELRQWLEKQSEQDSKIQPYRHTGMFQGRLPRMQYRERERRELSSKQCEL